MQQIQRKGLTDDLHAALELEEVHEWQDQQVDQGELEDLEDLEDPEELRPCTQQQLSRREQPRLHSRHNRVSSLFCDDRVEINVSKVQVETIGTNGYMEQRSKICFYFLAHPREKDSCSCRSFWLMRPRAG